MLKFDNFIEEIDLEKYLKEIPKYYTERLRYTPATKLKTILFGFMTNGISFYRNCKIMESIRLEAFLASIGLKSHNKKRRRSTVA